MEALEKTDDGDLAEVLPAANGLDAEILRLLIPATLAVFLDPAMALIDTGVHSLILRSTIQIAYHLVVREAPRNKT